MSNRNLLQALDEIAVKRVPRIMLAFQQAEEAEQEHYPWSPEWIAEEKLKTRNELVPILDTALKLKNGTVGPEGVYEIDAILKALDLPTTEDGG